MPICHLILALIKKLFRHFLAKRTILKHSLKPCIKVYIKLILTFTLRPYSLWVIFFTMILCCMAFSKLNYVYSTCKLSFFSWPHRVSTSFLSYLRFHDPSLWSILSKNPQLFCPLLSLVYLPWKFPNLFKCNFLSTLCHCNQTGVSSLLGESQTAGWVVTQRKLYLQQIRKSWAKASKAVTPWVVGFFLFRIRMHI